VSVCNRIASAYFAPEIVVSFLGNRFNQKRFSCFAVTFYIVVLLTRTQDNIADTQKPEASYSRIKVDKN